MYLYNQTASNLVKHSSSTLRIILWEKNKYSVISISRKDFTFFLNVFARYKFYSN